MSTGFYRYCLICGERYELDPQEVDDQTYSPLCTDCLRERSESNTPANPDHAERIVAEIN